MRSVSACLHSTKINQVAIFVRLIALLICPLNQSSGQVHYNFSSFESGIVSSEVGNAQSNEWANVPKPYVLILPGVLGKRVWDRNIRAGISHSKYVGDVEIYDWTDGPLSILGNFGGDIGESEYITNRIVQFKRQFPDRPFYLIGHSAGCRMAIQTLEKLPADCLIERAVLLSPCLESDYDLRESINRTRMGIVSFHSPLDVPISMPLTAVHGLTQGRIEMPATVFGFTNPGITEPRELEIYQQQLRQVGFRTDMILTGNIGGHFGWTLPPFVSQFVVPWLGPAS